MGLFFIFSEPHSPREGDYQVGGGRRGHRHRGAVAGTQSQATPADIRRILTLSAKRLSPGEDNFGFRLIHPLQALQLADPRTATTTPPAPKPATRQR